VKADVVTQCKGPLAGVVRDVPVCGKRSYKLIGTCWIGVALYKRIEDGAEDVESVSGVGADVGVGEIDGRLKDGGGCRIHGIVNLFFWSVAVR